MSRILLLAFCGLLTGCASVKNEFDGIAPEEVLVVIGYEIVGSKSLDPKLRVAGDIAGLFAGGLPGLVLLGGPDTINAVLRTNDPVTMVDELNAAIYQRIEDSLVMQGHKVRLLKSVPLAFESWRTDQLSANYFARVGKNYQLGASELQASGADAVLYVEYRIDANIKDMDQLQSMNAMDLQVDEIRRTMVAFSMPPHNQLLHKSTFRSSSLWNRMSFDATLACITSLADWPDNGR
jgi:hypothetical protein